MTEMASRQRALAVLWSTAFIDYMGFGIVVPILPLYARNFGATAFQAGLLLAIYSLAQWLTSTRWGRLSDRIGRRPVIVTAAAGGCVGFLLMACAPALWVAFVGRALLGSFGVAMPTAQAWVADTTPPHEQGRAMALLGAAAGLGFVAGPALGALGVAVGGMRLACFLAAGCSAANALLAGLALPHSRPTPRPHVSVGSGWRLVAPCLAVAFMLMYAFSGIEATFALYTTTELGFSPSDNGWAYAGMALVTVTTQILVVGPLSRSMSEPRRVGLGLLLLGVGIVGVPAGSLPALLPAITSMAVGYAIAFPSLAAWVSRRSPSERTGELLGLAQSVSSLARIAGPGVGGLLFDHVAHGAPFVISAAMLGIVAVATLARSS